VGSLRTLAFGGLAIVAVGAACGSDRSSSVARTHVVTSFYPLRFVAERIVGDRMIVTDLTPTGTEPHDVELTNRQTATVADAALVVYLRGFSPAVDDAVRLVARRSNFDVGSVLSLDLSNSAGVDPHFWLDPTRLATVADAVASRLSDADPVNAPTYAANVARLRADLERLDREFAANLTDCRSRVIVASHDAFGYFARRYGFTHKSITGPVPDVEASPTDMRNATGFIRANAVTTIYAESLVDPKLARTIASETGATTALLDPLEGLSDPESDYLVVMRRNLAVLRDGQGCA
jgi:zinc transport system substrate-binding protein